MLALETTIEVYLFLNWMYFSCKKTPASLTSELLLFHVSCYSALSTSSHLQIQQDFINRCGIATCDMVEYRKRQKDFQGFIDSTDP